MVSIFRQEIFTMYVYGIIQIENKKLFISKAKHKQKQKQKTDSAFHNTI